MGTRVNHREEVIVEEVMFKTWWRDEKTTDEDRDMAIGLILDHLKLEIVRTNATKHGNTEMVLREIKE